MEFILLFALLPIVALISDQSGSDEDDQDNPPRNERTRIDGTEDDDEILASNEDEDINALAGDDFVNGSGGDDLLHMGDGDDEGTGGDGNDTVNGDAGSDTMIGGGGDDEVNLGDGNDLYSPTVSPDDELAAGDDLVHGGAGKDVIYDNSGADTLYGDIGSDTLLADSVEGRDDAADQLFGGFGRDVLIGNDGDTMTGGAGEDTFVTYRKDAVLDGPITILDYSETQDELVIEWDVASLGAADSSDLTVFGDEAANQVQVFVQGQLVAILDGISDIDPSTLTVRPVMGAAA